MTKLRLTILLMIVSSFMLVAQGRNPAHAASGPPVPLGLEIKTEGIYRLTYGYLAAHHFDPRKVVVSKLGLSDATGPIPIHVHHGGSGPHFNRSDYIEFYAHPVLNTYTSTNVYVLTDDGSSVDPVREARASSAVNPVSVAQNTYLDENRSVHWLWVTVPEVYSVSTAWPSVGDTNWMETDFYLSAGQSSLSYHAGFKLSSPSPEGKCVISVPTIGFAYHSSGVPAFDMTIQIDHDLVTDSQTGAGQFSWTGTQGQVAYYEAQGTFPCTGLASGANAKEHITMGSTLQAGVQLASVLPESFTITYPEKLCGAGDQLQWDGQGESGYTVGGFNKPDIAVWLVTDHGVSRVSGIRAHLMPGGTCQSRQSYGVSFGGTQIAARYFASAEPLVPAGARRLSLGNITAGGPDSAQYLIITKPGWVKAVQPLAQYHESPAGGSMSVKVVDTQSIYDQYRSRVGAFVTSPGPMGAPGDGLLNPEAIRAYIDFARIHLGTQYVLLAGGDTLDYHNSFKCPSSGICFAPNVDNVSVVPSLYVHADFAGLAESDNLYAVPPNAQTMAPDVAIGRLPAVTKAQLQVEIDKTIAWPRLVSSYARRATFVAGWEDPEFASASDTMASLLAGSGGWTITKAYESGQAAQDQTVHNTLVSQIDDGQEIVDFVGHGNFTQWSFTPALQASDVATLTNSNKPAVILQWGCETTYLDPRLAQLDALLMDATDSRGNPTGAVLTVGSGGEDLAYPQTVLAGGTAETGPSGGRYFLGYLLGGATVGKAMELAKDDMIAAHGSDSDFVDVVSSYEIFGDPALVIPV